MDRDRVACHVARRIEVNIRAGSFYVGANDSVRLIEHFDVRKGNIVWRLVSRCDTVIRGVCHSRTFRKWAITEVQDNDCRIVNRYAPIESAGVEMQGQRAP